MAAFNGSDDPSSMIKALLARSGGQSQGMGMPFSGLPFSGLPQVPKASMFTTDFAPQQARASAPEVSFLPPPEPPRVERIRTGEAFGEGMLERAAANFGKQQAPAPDDGMQKIRDALAASKNALSTLYNTPTPAQNDRATQGPAPGNKFFAAKPKKQFYTPDQAPEGVMGGVEEMSDMAGIPAGYFNYLRGQESGTDDSAVNKLSGASGRYQFMPGTVKDLVSRVPSLAGVIDDNWRKDPKQQEALLRAYTQLSLDALKPIIKDRMPTMGELYAMHFFGHSGGRRALTNADKKLGELFPDVVFEQNPTLSRDMTPAQFVQYINDAWK